MSVAGLVLNNFFIQCRERKLFFENNVDENYCRHKKKDYEEEELALHVVYASVDETSVGKGPH